MNITNIQLNKVLELHMHKVHSTQASSDISPASKADEFILSNRATAMQRIKETMASLPDMRTGVVKDFQTKIGNGEYDVSGLDLADKMMSSALEFRKRM